MPKHPFSKSFLLHALLIAGVGCGLFACANMARPGGGPKDKTPPRFVRSTPAPQALNVSKNKIEIDFDENILLEKPSEKVVISPAQKNMPTIRSNGKRISVELKDSLLVNTTYTLDFTDAIVDNNEKNPLNSFVLSFSTGNTLDTLEVSGYLLNATNLEPITGMMVGLHQNLEDSAFTTLPLDRITLSDAYGHFTVRGIAPGSYRVYALKDGNRDYLFDNPTEDIAFYDSVITPRMEMSLHTDTLWIDTLTIDTILQHMMPDYYPNDLLLRVFNEDFKVQYLDKNERPTPEKISLYFTAPADSLPEISWIGLPDSLEIRPDWYFLEKSLHNDTLTYWLRDSVLMAQDTLRFALRYLRTDTLQQLTPFNDTIRSIYKRPKLSKKEQKRLKELEELPDSLKPSKPIVFMGVNTIIPSVLNVYDDLRITPDHPILSFDSTAVHLELKIDSAYKEIPFQLKNDSLQLRTWHIQSKWEPGKEYRIRIDSAAIIGLYGLYNSKIENLFSVKPLEKYSNLKISVRGVRNGAFLELLNSSDVPVRKAVVRNGTARFMHMDPGVYYLRMTIDPNGNEKFDTGNYAEKRQPETVYYYPGSIELRENWNITNEWEPFALPLYQQKPRAIVKNKPKEEKVEKNKDGSSDINYGDRSPYNRNTVGMGETSR